MVGTPLDAFASGAFAHPTRITLAKKFFRIPYPRPQNLAYPARVLFDGGRFPEAILRRIERELAGPGRPGTGDSLVVGGARGGAAPSLGRARSPCRARWVHHPPPRVPRKHPGASHRSIPSRGCRGTGKPRTLCAARMRGLGCLKLPNRNVKRGSS